MQEEHRSCYNIIIAVRKEVFERLQENIVNLNTKNITLLGITLATVSISLTILYNLHQKGLQFSIIDTVLLYFFGISLFYSLIINIWLAIPRRYKDLEIFKDKRFDELKNMSEQTRYDDILDALKEAYSNNINLYNERMLWYTYALCFFITAAIISTLLIVKKIAEGPVPYIYFIIAVIVFTVFVGVIECRKKIQKKI
jgi:hypothetical protein